MHVDCCILYLNIIYCFYFYSQTLHQSFSLWLSWSIMHSTLCVHYCHSCKWLVSFPSISPSHPAFVSPPYLSLSSQPETDQGLFIADKAANFINYEAICYSACFPACVSAWVSVCVCAFMRAHVCACVCIWSNGGIWGSLELASGRGIGRKKGEMRHMRDGGQM